MDSIFVLLVVIVLLVSPSSGSRSVLRTIGDGADIPDAAVDLNASNFDAVLRGAHANFAIVEFFAHWCPSCRNYKPHYEKVASLFNGLNAVHPGIILMTRVDCALKINIKLCDKFSVRHYPLLLWGKPSKFTFGGWEPGKDDSEIKGVDDWHTAEQLLNWINKQMGRQDGNSSFGLDNKKHENEHHQLNSSDPEQIARAVYDVEEATAVAFEILLPHKMIKARNRALVIKFLQLLVAHHPSRRCRKGSAEALVNFDDLYPSKMRINEEQKELSDNRKTTSGDFQICGKEVPRGYWIFCRGSENDSRGFSCGLWVLLHSLSVRIEDEESHMAFTTICDFIHNFFICEECRQHFYEMCSSVKISFNKTRDYALWLWSAHNIVNERLKKEEASSQTADPKFPKMLWPPKQLCPKCYLSTVEKSNDGTQISWDQDEVFKFLVSYYGNMLVSLDTDKDLLSDGEVVHTLSEDMTATTHAVVVPIGAALAIALASCAFGVLAWIWRSQQKSRKNRHHLHSLKDI